MFARALLFFALLLAGLAAWAAVLPEDRSDAMLHVYDGGGVEVSGPSVLVRKSIGDKVSVSGNYYVDSISSASIDVITTASAYTEERKEKSLAVDYLHNKTLMSLAYTNSDESDYSATTASFNISQDFFGDLTTLSLGYAVGNDEIRNNTVPTFQGSADRQNYRLGLTQILTKNSLLAINWETITDQGFLNNPYRQVRILENGVPTFKQEAYPETRTSNALAMRLRWYLPYRAAVNGEVRYFNDTWGIRAQNAEIGYTHPLEDAWVFDVKYRFYTQNAADFYSDLFDQEFTYMARDKELSSFSSQTFGLGVSYEFAKSGWKFIDRGSLNLSYDYIRFSYDDFRDLRDDTIPAGEEPLYSFDANVWKAYFSIWY
jgi:hypothetical protein